MAQVQVKLTQHVGLGLTLGTCGPHVRPLAAAFYAKGKGVSKNQGPVLRVLAKRILVCWGPF